MRRYALRAIRFYQRSVSPAMPPSCKYMPTCSEYGYDAIARLGLIRGCVLLAWRLLRCNPLSRGGYDPVPGSAKEGDAASSA